MSYTFLLRNCAALAFSFNSTASTLCTLTIKYHAQLHQASITVHLPTQVHGFAEALDFALTYHADNLAPDKTFLGPVPDNITADELSGIARRGTPVFRTLCLALRAPCLVQCPPSTGCFAPKPGHTARFHQLQDLASSTQVRVVFDGNWLQEQQYAVFYRLLNHPNKFAALPYRGPLSRQVDWTAFSPINDDLPEKLPQYERALKHRTSKRRGSSGSCPSPAPPPSKRERAVSPTPEAGPTTPLPPDYGSPTEKATPTTQWDSPCSRGDPSSSKKVPISQEVTKAALDALLRDAIQDALPKMLLTELARAFAISPPPDPSTAGSIGSLITNRIASDVQSRLEPLHAKAIEDTRTNTVEQISDEHVGHIVLDKLKKQIHNVMDEAHDIRANADLLFFEELEAHRLDVVMAKDDALDEIRNEMATKHADLLATAEEVVLRSGADAQRRASDYWNMVRHALSEREDVFQRKIAREHAAREGTPQRSASVPL